MPARPVAPRFSTTSAHTRPRPTASVQGCEPEFPPGLRLVVHAEDEQPGADRLGRSGRCRPDDRLRLHRRDQDGDAEVDRERGHDGAGHDHTERHHRAAEAGQPSWSLRDTVFQVPHPYPLLDGEPAE